MKALTCFKTYDIRGKIGENLDADIVYRIARAFAKVLQAKKVVIARDSRESSFGLSESLVEGLMHEGVDVLDIGLAGTEEMYFATSNYSCDGGIIVTASHNPKNYNGLKMVKSRSRPLDIESEFLEIKKLAEAQDFGKKKSGARVSLESDSREAYVNKVISFIDIDKMPPLKMVINCGNGTAGPTFDAIARKLIEMQPSFQFIRVFHDVDSSFPNGVPNPLLEENRSSTAEKVVAVSADIGVAFDGDFDRCFLFDESGTFIPGEYIVGLLASTFLKKEPQSIIVHDTRVIWNTADLVKKNNGVPMQSKTGHAFMKQKMREVNAIYGGEISAHHYFRDFFYCDSGMIPWLMIVELMGIDKSKLSTLINERKKLYPSSGEINLKLNEPTNAILKVEKFFEGKYIEKDKTDGVSLSFKNWRMNIRKSNTEPLVRLNIESKSDPSLVEQKVELVKDIILN